jgi:hypothetical protein
MGSKKIDGLFFVIIGDNAYYHANSWNSPKDSPKDSPWNSYWKKPWDITNVSWISWISDKLSGTFVSW